MSDAFPATIGSLDQLRSLYREPSGLVRSKKLDHLDDAARGFVAGSPFCLLATADRDGRCDVSPRGGPPGFVRVLDERRLVLPDLSGNNLLDSLSNIVANPGCGLLFIVPGRDETLRLDGTASITTDPALLSLWDDELRTPKVAIGVEVANAFIHCAKSFRRGWVWDPASWSELDAPDACDILVSNLGLDDDAAAALRDQREDAYVRALDEERRSS